MFPAHSLFVSQSINRANQSILLATMVSHLFAAIGTNRVEARPQAVPVYLDPSKPDFGVKNAKYSAFIALIAPPNYTKF